ncbi:recombinase family protein [Streptomyces montanisoli]|uniref:Recombinase family protein n=1 Tax=Streptomyces montanisoli TaxID=2798581 RepID=A0A940M5S4_9ACTN|nr:recombinase family protein [Streptomyces montanisoli]MBP0456659.1 recombinase family protein [Streptomyces montanisoli]
MTEQVHGYMRAYPGTPDDEIEADQERMRAWAVGRGWELVEVHEETAEGSLAALDELVEALGRTGARSVLVPSFQHLGTNLVLQAHLVDHLLWTRGAEVHSVGAPR